VKTSSLCFVALLAAVGCGSNAHEGDPAPATASCNAYCDAYIAAACSPSNYATGDACKTAECRDIAKAPPICFDEFKAFYDCAKALTPAELCADTSCSDLFDNLLACSGG
jgi:hypothetical protein